MSGKSGDNLAKRLGDIGGVEDKAPKVPLSAISFYKPGHPLAHARQFLFDAVNNPQDRALVDSIKRGFRKDYPFGCREEGRGRPLGLVCGSRRYNAALVAERELIEEGNPAVKGKNGRPDGLMVPVVVRAGSDAEMLRWRIEENADPLAVPDTPSVLSDTFRAMVDLGMTHEDLAAIHGHGFTAETIEALCRMPNLKPDLVARFDSGDVPLDVLGAILDAPEDEREQLLISIMTPLEHLSKEKRTKRRVKAAIREAQRDEPVKETPRMLPRKKLDRVWKGVEERLADPDDGKAQGKEWDAAVKMLRFVIDGDPDALEGLPDYLIVTVKASLAARKPGRKAKMES